MLIEAFEAFEVVEGFTKVKKVSGSEDAVRPGRRKRIRLAKSKEILQFVGKVMGHVDGEEEDNSKVSRSLQVTFISTLGNNMNLNIGLMENEGWWKRTNAPRYPQLCRSFPRKRTLPHEQECGLLNQFTMSRFPKPPEPTR